MSYKRQRNESAWEQASQKSQQTECGEPQLRGERKAPRRAVPQTQPAFARPQVKVWHEGAD